MLAGLSVQVSKKNLTSETMPRVTKVVVAFLLTSNLTAIAFAADAGEQPNPQAPNTDSIQSRSEAVQAAGARKVAWLKAGQEGCKRLIQDGSESKVLRGQAITADGANYTLIAERQNGETCYCNFSDHALTEQEIGLTCQRSI